MSDAPTPSETTVTEGKAPRSGSHAKRKKYIKEKLENAIEAGDMPDHCDNCGEIDTPTWRRTYTRIEYGTPEGIELSATGVVAYEIIEPTPENGDEPKYRVYRNKITQEEKHFNCYDALKLCNPCGLWLIKNGHSRPQKLWEKPSKAAKRRRNPGMSSRTRSLCPDNDIASDAAVPQSDTVEPEEQHTSVGPVEGHVDKGMLPPSSRQRASSSQANEMSLAEVNGGAEAALQRAIQSSPAGLQGAKNSPIDLESDLTPRPTRRLLFPSPRKDGEVKLLDLNQAKPTSPTQSLSQCVAEKEDPPEKPRCERCKKRKRRCDRERPCGTCADAGLDYDDCIPCPLPRKTWFDEHTAPVAPVEPATVPPIIADEEGVDKENCPPTGPVEENDDLAYLFETPGPAKTTPKKDESSFLDVLKTPTPGSRRRAPLTPKRGVDDADRQMTPSRNIFTFTPRVTRSATTAPDTPFTRQLNAMLSDALQSSPSQAMDFSSFPVFNTPGRTSGAQFSDFLNDDFLSSDMPVSSSPARNGVLGLGFDLYEDPNTSTVGLWNDTSMFGNDAVMLDIENDAKGGTDTADGAGATAMLKMSVGGITVDFASMIEEVVGNNEENTKDTETEVSPEAVSQGLAQTPEVPTEE
jgi:hypothetical protein